MSKIPRKISPADRLRKVLAASGLSQVKLAEAIGADPATLRRWLADDTATARAVPDSASRLLWLLDHNPNLTAELARLGYGNTLSRLLQIGSRHPAALRELVNSYEV